MVGNLLLLFLAIVLTSCAALIVKTNEDDLVALVQIFRHGQRNPITWYANDPYKDASYWPLGNGQLTKEGKRQHYDLGKFTRGRYGNFLPRNYDPSWFRAQTTDVDRTHMSCQSNLAYIFRPSENETWNTQLSWQPIPVHPIEKNIIATSVDCTIYNTELANVLVNDELYKAFNTEFADLYTYLSTYTGDNVTSVMSVYEIYDTLHIEEIFGYQLPSWTNSVYPEPLRTLSAYAFASYSRTTEMKRLTAGSWLNTVANYFENIFKDPSSYPKFQMWSAHDNNIANILDTLGAFDPHCPAFASTIYFELRNKSGTPIVNVWHKDDDLDIIEAITVKDCAFDCSLSNFRKALSDYIIDIDTWNEECAANSTSYTESEVALTSAEVAQVLQHVKQMIIMRQT